MATDKPISGFSTLASADVDPGDLLPIVDVTDTSSAPTGTTKSVLLSSLLGNPNNGAVQGILTPVQGTPAAGTIVKTALNGMVAQSSGGSSTDFMWNESNGTTIAYAESGRFVVPGAIVGNQFQGGTLKPTATKSAGTATVTGLKVEGQDTSGANGNDAGGNVIWTVTGTGSWTIRITFTAGYTAIPAVVISPADAVLPTLFPYVSAISTTYFEVTGNNFGATGGYGFSYVVIG